MANRVADRQELERLLHTGPFAEAFRAAIQARGLGLERIRTRLAGQGVSISLATLSYWQSGRSRPERRDSIVALTHLEQVLEVAPGSFTALLGPPRPRGRWLTKAPDTPGITAFWPDSDPIGSAVRDVDTRWDSRLTRISQHDLVTVGPDREERSIVSRQVLRAEADGPDRWVAILHIDDRPSTLPRDLARPPKPIAVPARPSTLPRDLARPPTPIAVPARPSTLPRDLARPPTPIAVPAHERTLPLVRPLRHCRLGRVVNRAQDGLVVAELLFDRPLSRGETIITEHALVNRAPCPLATNYERKFRLPVREFVLEICFDPAALPNRCLQYTRMEGLREHATPAFISKAHSVHGVALNFGPGSYGFRWDWD